MLNFLDFIRANKEWLFSGVGVTVLVLVGTLVVRIVRRSSTPPALSPPQPPPQPITLAVTVSPTPAPLPAILPLEPPTSAPVVSGSLSHERTDVLRLLADVSGQRPPATSDVAALLSLPHARVEFILNELADQGLVEPVIRLGKGALWFLSQQGRRYLIESGLL
mgnify:CR=1 FL=1